MSRIFLLVLDSFGIGEALDSKEYNDEGSNTLKSITKSKYFNCPTLCNLGLFNIDGVKELNIQRKNPCGVYCRLQEESCGKDSTTGHWEMAGKVLKEPFPTYEFFDEKIIKELTNVWNVNGILCNKRYSGTEVIKDYGQEHLKTKKPIVYTSADSVLQIACHEKVFSIKKLYKMCEDARKIMCGKNSVSRVIARPFVGDYPNYVRTENRRDFSITPPSGLLLEVVKNEGLQTISIGKIKDLFNNIGISKSYPNNGNTGEIVSLKKVLKQKFNGLCWLNFCDFDSKYGHRNDVDGYAKALNEVDCALNDFVKEMKEEDYLLITADHGCDPATASTDHSREYVPFIIYNKNLKSKDCGTLSGFYHVGATVLKILGIKSKNKYLSSKFSVI